MATPDQFRNMVNRALPRAPSPPASVAKLASSETAGGQSARKKGRIAAAFFIMIKKRRKLAHRLLEVLINFIEEARGGEPPLLSANQQRQIFGHVTTFDGFDDGCF